MEDLDKDISFHRDALALHPAGHPDRSISLHNLAEALMNRYYQCNTTEDMENAISFYHETVTLRTFGHPDRSITLNDLANALRSRYDLYSEMEDLEDSISLHHEALTLHPPGHLDHAMSLNNLSLSLIRQYDRLGNIEDLEACMSLHRKALSLRPPGDPDRTNSLNNLAEVVLTRYSQFGNVDDLEESVLFCREAVTLCHPGHRDRLLSLNNLARALRSRYDRFGEMKDLEDCILFNHDALTLLPDGHPRRFSSLNNLAIALMRRYDQCGTVEDLEDSISFHRDALALRPPGHADQSVTLNNLALVLMRRYEQFGKIADLEEGISFYRALFLRPPGHLDRSMLLHNLAIALMRQYQQFGEIDGLEESILLSHDALSLRPPGHPDRSSSLNHLANVLMSRYSRFGKIDDLEKSISFYYDALTLCPPGHPDRSLTLSNLANVLMGRYEQFGKVEDLEDCILFHRDALILCPPGNPERYVCLLNLARALIRRYDHLGKTEDLEACMSFYRDALSLCPPGHPDRSRCLNGLAVALMRRYYQSGTVRDLDDCILFHHDALDLRPAGHPDRSMSLNDLAVALLLRYENKSTGPHQNIKEKDLEDCVLFHRNALSLRPPGHIDRALSLNNLAIALIRQYEQSGKVENLEDCISLHRDALTLRPPGHPDRAVSHHDLAVALLSRYNRLNRMEDIEGTFTHYEQAANDVILNIASTLQCNGHMLPGIININPHCVESQHRFLATANLPRSLASDAASAAIQAGNLELAVELLELGRAMLWSKVDAYKYPLEQLRQVNGGGELADRLETLSADLEHLVLLSSAATTSDKEPSIPIFDSQMKQHRILSEEWEDLVGRIREIDGFGNFLKAPPFNTLKSAAAEGPVILVNISSYRSDAIIIHSNNAPILVTLPNVRTDELKSQVKKRSSKREVVGVLRYLWETIVSPVVDCLDEFGIPKMSRIWWCPTAELCALPLHAAGPYKGGKKNLPNLYTCSYISTLSSLIRARSDIVQPSTSPKLLIVGQPSETQKLEQVEVEVNIVKKLSSDKSVDILFGPEANREAVLDSLKKHSWVHFACHGHLGEDSQPFRASFELHDGRRLSLLDLIRARIPNAELAFLPACHSAAGDSLTPDENIHLSAALQFCGFRSVVGMLWEMDDEDGPMISREFYKYMFRNPGKTDFRMSAHALSSAIRAMRKAKLPPERWVMFVHIGA